MDGAEVYLGHMPYSQKTLLTVSRCPFVLDDPSDVPLEECWFALLKLYLTCGLRPRVGESPTGCRTKGEVDIAGQLMFYSTFEVLGLPVQVRWKLVAL